jgi:beta-lactamase regulating signal transducer with metallopeptidase domain
MMTTNVALAASTSLLVQLADPALRALLVASAAGVTMALFKVRSTTMRLTAWTAVLYVALLMPLLTWIVPAVPVPAPRFRYQVPTSPRVKEVQTPSPSSLRAHDHATDLKIESDQSTESIVIHPRTISTTAAPSRALRTSGLSIPWSILAIGLYVAVALILFTRFAVGLVFSRRLVRASQEIRDLRVAQSLPHRARGCGLRSVPRIAESELISVPVTLGILRAIILLPASWREWDDEKLNAVLAHEVSHVARRDALTQCLSLFHRTTFWFSPLAWWLHRQLAELAEQASDEAALCCGADRNDYARTLLGFFETLEAAPGRVWWQGVSMAKAGQAEQRLERILAWKGAVTMGLKKSVLVAIIALALPVLYLAASVRPTGASSQDAERAQIPIAPPAPETAATPAAPPAASELPEPAIAPAAPRSAMTPPAAVNGIVSHGGRLWVSPAAPTAPGAAVAPVPPLARWPYQSAGKGHSYSYHYDDEPRFVIVSGTSDSMTMSGSSEDARHAEKLKKQISGDFIWFERDEKSYIIRDPAMIDRARKLWAPQEELGKKQEELGKQQEALGKQQEELGKKMEQVQVKVPDMTAELDRLKAKVQKLGANATMEQLGDLQSEIGDLQSKIGEIQSQAGEQQSKLGEQMGALGEKQGKLGEEQGKLGEQQGELAEQASRQMKELLNEAIQNGKAQPEPPTGGTGTL